MGQSFPKGKYKDNTGQLDVANTHTKVALWEKKMTEIPSMEADVWECLRYILAWYSALPSPQQQE